jgi:hypothetical protein
MEHLPTAFAQLQFAWKLYNYALDGNIDLDKLDTPVVFQEDSMVFILPDRIFHSNDDMIIALENMLGVAFGAAAITLNRSREEAGVPFPKVIVSEVEQFVVLVYQIRNAFAHDISEPRWEIRNPTFLREYEFGPVHVDLTNLNGQRFDYRHIGGPEVLFWMKEYGDTQVWTEQHVEVDAT